MAVNLQENEEKEGKEEREEEEGGGNVEEGPEQMEDDDEPRVIMVKPGFIGGRYLPKGLKVYLGIGFG